jgi:hypothetical protein
MNLEHRETPIEIETPRWEPCSILLWGTLGTRGPAERRYIVRCYLATVLAAAWLVVAKFAHFRPKPVILSVTTLVGGIVITFIALEFRHYLSEIDELARRMQLEAMAWTYLTGFVVAAWLGVAGALSQTLFHWAFKPEVLLMIPYLFFLLEPVRGGWLYYLSRRY